MKTIKTTLSYFFIFLLFSGCKKQLNAQTSNLSTAYKEAVVSKLSQELEDRYVFPELGTKTAKHLDKLWKDNHFTKVKQLEAFAEMLTESVYEVCKDKHISINLIKQEEIESEGKKKLPQWIQNKLGERTYYRRYGANFKSVTKMDNNIGYLDLRGFYGLDYGRNFADHAMAKLATSDAIIIDLRKNSGGRGDMVNYLASYFFNKPVIGSKTRKRSGDQFTERIHMIDKQINGKKMPDVPLFILTSGITFSAAEGFSYPMKVYKRATFIGETTKGGANPGDIIPLNEELEVFIPDVSVTHPLTNSSWEGVGIEPDLKVPSEQALDVAIEEATKAAKAFKTSQDEKAKSTILSLDEKLSNFKGSDNKEIIDAYLECKKYDIIFEEWELNRLGYQYLSKPNSKTTAEAIFESNTVLYPNSPNTYDSYAEALLANGKMKLAITNYEKAVQLAKDTDHPNLKLYMESLDKLKKK